MRQAFLALALLTPASAFAQSWEHTGWVWPPEALPVPYWVGQYVEDSIEDPDYQQTMIPLAYQAWIDGAPCSSFRAEYMGALEPAEYNPGPDTSNFQNYVTFDDPTGIQSAGTLAVTYTKSSSNPAFTQDGRTYFKASDSDIVFNNDVNWATHTDIDDGNCSAETSMLAVAVHEIGHLQGLDHTCEADEECDQDGFTATMYYAAGEDCDNSRAVIDNRNDIEAITALYGPYATFQCSNEVEPGADDTVAFGTVPFPLRCVMIAKDADEVDSATWYWGDGGTEEGKEVEHTYETPGNYTIRVEFAGNSPDCGDWSFDYRRVGYVRACGIPEPTFTWEHVNGLTYKFVNETDVSVYGCIFEIQWDIFKDGQLVDSIQAWEPQYTFDTEGEYRIVLNVGGPAGTGAADLVIDAKNRAGEGYGCNVGAVGATGFGGLFGLSMLVVGFRRRD